MQAIPTSKGRNLHLLEIQSPHDALRRAQMCDERISVVYLRHRGIVIYMKTPYVAQGTSARAATILHEWIMVYTLATPAIERGTL